VDNLQLPGLGASEGSAAREDGPSRSAVRPRASATLGSMAPRAIDLYSGVGGWALGLALAGIEVIESYEWWDEAALTHERNFGKPVTQVDIRSLDVTSLPDNLDFVVGSPPCTQFSFSNRGGNGDIADGLKDIIKFMEAVAYVQPRYWVMENVPRVAQILEKEIGRGGHLRRFRDLLSEIIVVDMADFGLPQGRKRMLAGNFPADLLVSYSSNAKARTLGDVVGSLAEDPVRDPLYGLTLPRAEVTGLAIESSLDYEETRMNRESKQYHPVYNVMQFPDELDRPSRTVTALCTRVSRESIVIEGDSGYRRLSLRERASLQGFPTTFQFHGKTHPSNLKMVGNAVPPWMTYYVAQAMQDKRVVREPGVSRLRKALPRPARAIEVQPETARKRYSASRQFRAAIPGLRFGSGTRVELSNHASSATPTWNTAFFFGTSKDFQEVTLDDELEEKLTALLRAAKVRMGSIHEARRSLLKWLADVDLQSLQSVWCQRSEGTHPFEVVDHLGETAFELEAVLAEAAQAKLEDGVADLLLGGPKANGPKARKLRLHASRILAGLLVGCWFNGHADRQNLSLAV